MVPAIEDLDSMSLEQITELREKIRKKVEKAQEEEMVSQAKQQEQDDDYEYMWEEADPEEEEAKKVDEIIQGLGSIAFYTVLLYIFNNTLLCTLIVW